MTQEVNMRAHDIMTTDPACCTADDAISTVARLMEERDCGCIPVVAGIDDASLIGVITDRDIAVRGIAHGRNGDTKAADLMTPSPFCCNPDTDVNEIERLMSQHQIRRIAVVDDGGHCVGMVAQADLALAADRNGAVTDDDVGRVVEAISEPRPIH
jgi:CBS domain-containing protein